MEWGVKRPADGRTSRAAADHPVCYGFMTYRFALCFVAALSFSCSDDSGGSGGGSGGADAGGACPTADSRFEVGDEQGHADPYGAAEAGQARAGRLTEELIVQPAHGRQRVRPGDYVLANSRIAVVIEAPGSSDGYARFGGEILAVDRTGDDGRPAGVSSYVETLMPLGIEVVNPRSVTVLSDGSDGSAAVVRATGPLEAIPFLDGALGVLFPRRYGLEGAVDYVLAPDSEKLEIRLGVINPSEEPVQFSFEPAPGSLVTDEMHGFFHDNHNQFVAPATGFAKPSGELPWAGFVARDGGRWAFAWRAAGGETIQSNATISGFRYFTGPGFTAAACDTTFSTHAEVIAGGPEYDGLLAAIRRVDGEPPWREVSGTMRDAAGNPLADAWVHELDGDGSYLSRARTDDQGNYVLHAPDRAVQLAAQKRGLPRSAPVDLLASESNKDLTFQQNGTITVTATDAAGGMPLPVRVQVLPTGDGTSTPDEWGVQDEARGRLHNDFAVSGSSTLPVPPGEYRVVVSRGYEWELIERTITVGEGETVAVDAVLEHSVDSTGVLCGDFHIHSAHSADSSDPIEHKVKGAIADGLDIPVSSEHEWVVDFQPVIERLGLQRWAWGGSSEELTTFTWGHFGVVPLIPRPDEPNFGAVDWIGKDPADVFGAVRALPENPVLIVNHPSGGGFGAYFDAAGLDRSTATGDAPLWSNDFDAIEVFNDSGLDSNRDGSVADWFALLEGGFTFWAVGSSDSHSIRSSPVGYPRTCMRFGHDDPTLLSPMALRDALGSGASTISGGLFMTVEGPNGVGPGDTIDAAPATVEFTVTVQAPSWIDARELEVIVNGETISTEALLPLGPGPAKRWVNVVSVPVDAARERNWVVFHARSDSDLSPLHPGRRAFAASNPVFLVP